MIRRVGCGDVLIVTSALTIAEVLWMRGAPCPTKDKAKLVHEFFRCSYTCVYNKDAIHVATAIYLRADVLETFDQDLITNLRTRTGNTKKVASFSRKPVSSNATETNPFLRTSYDEYPDRNPKKEKTQDHPTRIF